MQKVGEIFSSSAGHADKDEQVQGSGGGGPVEAVWWIKDTGTQWRIKGQAFVVGRDIEGDGEESSGVRTVKSEVGERMRVVDGSKEQEWSWGRELTAHFGNCSPGMRGTSQSNPYSLSRADLCSYGFLGSWKNPPPGTQVKGEPDKDHQLAQKVTDLHDPIARANFRVVIIKPEEVEQTDISDPAKARRYKYTFVVEKGQDAEGKGEWKMEELWP